MFAHCRVAVFFFFFFFFWSVFTLVSANRRIQSTPSDPQTFLILIYNIYNCITPSCLEYIVQRKQSKCDHCVQRFQTYYMKDSISYRGSIVWNLLELYAVSTSYYAKRAKKSHTLRNLNFNEESPQMGSHQIDMWCRRSLILFIFLLYIFHLLLTTSNFYHFNNIFLHCPISYISFKTHRV